MTDLNAIGITCCRLIVACDRVGDYERAAQWCGRMDEFARRWQIRSFLGVCRTAYASVLLERGSWAVRDAVKEQPWLPNGPIATTVTYRMPGYQRVSHDVGARRAAAVA